MDKITLAKTIDHAVLKPEFTSADLIKHAQMCMEYRVYSMCVRPYDVANAKKLLEGSDVKLSSVLSFPHGIDSSSVKVLQARQAINDGVDEIDMVMNIGEFMSENYNYVVDDIAAVVEVAHSFGVLVKVIQESGYLTLDQVKRASEISLSAGADFVKTSTGFGPGGATPEVVKAMVESVGGRIKIKASGGIRTWKDAVNFLSIGADRLGIGSTEQILSGGESGEQY